MIDEIRANIELRVLGGGLALVHLLTYVLWFLSDQASLASTRNLDPICWPFFSNCEVAKVLTPAGVTIFGAIYCNLSIVAAACFLYRRSVRVGCGLLAALFLMHL